MSTQKMSKPDDWSATTDLPPAASLIPLSPLGETGLTVSRLSLGGLFVSSAGAKADEARAAVGRALELGINYIDTAPTYSDSEKVLGQILQGEERPFILSTKLGGRPDPFDPKNVAQLRQSFEESLRLLGRDSVDILMVHEPDRPGLWDWWEDFVAVQGPVLDLLAELKEEGLIRFTGLGGTTTCEMAHLCASGKFDVVLTAFNYSILWREAEATVLSAAKKAGMGIIIGSPLQQGVLATRQNAIDDPAAYWLHPARKEQFRRLYALCDASEIPLPEMALRFTLSHPDVSTVLTGAKSVAEVEQNVQAAIRGPLPPEILHQLDEIAAMVPFRPCGEPMGLGWRIANPAWHRGMGPLV